LLVLSEVGADLHEISDLNLPLIDVYGALTTAR